MASSILTKDEQNFIRFVKICLDVFKRPLADILASEIQPADLYNKIKQHSCSLLNGKNKLDSKQEKICFLSPPAIPDYNEFDVTLLYKLIRNLCPSLVPTKGWGKDPLDTDTQIGDDIERLRLFRNNNFHEVSSEISDNNFEIICKKLKFVFQRVQNHMASKGYNANYEENMTNIKQLNLGDEHIDKYKIAFLERTIDQLQADGMEKPKISIKGPTNILCGNDAKFTADINPENRKGWSITWQKKVQQTSTRINTSTEKYSGSTDRSLVIRHVCKGDTGGYQAILSRDSEAKNISVSSNVIVLQAIGGPPIFEVWDVTTGVNGIRIHYRFKKRPPDVTDIKWIKDEVPILKRNKKYEGGKLNDSYFTITSPTIEDRGHYSCVVQNVVGSVQKDVQFDVPNVEISTEQEVYFGSKTSFTSRIVSCPSPDGAEWQQSNDGKTFKYIIISKPKYYGSSCDPKSPLLIIPKVTFEDKLYYRLLVWNKIGEQYSNTVFLDVKGSLPNITISHRTCVLDRSITLIGNVFLYGSLPAVKNVFWTKNGEELDTNGSGGRYSEVTVDNPSLTIFDVNQYDAGSYLLTATNAVGSTTSDFLILDVPDVSMAKPEKKNSGFWFTVTIKSIPAPDFAQWSIKEKSSDTFIPIDENAEEFKGTSNTLPHPVLVFNPKTDLEDYCLQIEVRNFIGSCIKITPGEGSSDDPFTNGNQGGLSKIYLDGGSGLKFAKLFDDIAELFPEKKTRRLKDFIQNSQNCKDIALFAETVTARDCLEILRDHKLFTPWDVIFMQYLLKNTECKELFEKCVAYGQAHGALCFYEKLPENGYKNVQFHVRANLSCYTQVEIRKILETVADIVGCNSTEIFVNGYRHSSSFLVVLSIEKKHVKKLLTMKQQEKDKLSCLNIDYFIVDFIKVYLQSPQEIRGADDNGDYPTMLQKLWGKPTTLRYALFERHSKELDPVTSDIVNAKYMTSISVSAKEVKHISCIMPNRFWVSDMKKVQEIDKNGKTLKELDINFTLFGSHTLTQSGDLLFLKDNDVFWLTSNGEVRNLFIHTSVHFCIHCSRMNDDILIGDINIVTRYNILGFKQDEINLDDEGQSLYVETIFITENTNGDIIVSDNGKKAIVVTNKSGRHLFNYKGHHFQTTFHPGGICTDVFGHILVCNVSSDPSVHLLNEKGKFLTYLLTKHQHGSDCPQALCVDNQHNLYVGYSNKNRINVYSYLTNEHLRDLLTKEVEANTNSELTAHSKEILLVDSHNVEKILNEFHSSKQVPKTTPRSFYRIHAKTTDSEPQRESVLKADAVYAKRTDSDPLIPLRKRLSMNVVSPCSIPSRKRLSMNLAHARDRSLGQTSTATLKHPMKENYDTKEMAPLIPHMKRLSRNVDTHAFDRPSLRRTSTATLKHPMEENYDTKEMGPVATLLLKVAEHKRRLKEQTGLELIEISSDDNYKIESEEILNTIKVMERVTDDFLRFTYTKLNKIDSSKTCVEPWPPTTSVSADGYKLHYRFPRSTHLLDVVLHKDRGETIGPYIELLYELANHIDSFHSAGWIFRCLRAKNVWILETQKREQSIVVPKFGKYRMIVSSEFDAHPEQIKVDSREEMEGVQWLSIEAIKAGVYSKESDVYAFGMVTWEVMTAFGQEGVVYDQDEERELSCTPFKYQQSENILQHLIEGYIPEKPVKCPDWFYQEVTRPCLLHQKIDRPSMKTVLQILQTRLGKTLPRQILSLPPSVPPELYDVYEDDDNWYEDDYEDWGVAYTSPNPSDDKESIKPVEDDRANSPVFKRKPPTPPKINMEKKDSHADEDTHKGSDFNRSDNLGDTQKGSDIDRRVGAAKDKSIGDEPTSAIKTKPRVFPKPKAKPKSPFYVNDQELKADDVSTPVYVNQNQPGTKPVVPHRKPLNK